MVCYNVAVISTDWELYRHRVYGITQYVVRIDHNWRNVPINMQEISIQGLFMMQPPVATDNLD